MIDQPTLLLLVAAFAAVAFLYASVGLGGGSAYTALLALAGVSHVLVPTVSLALNLVVTFVGMINFHRGGHLSLRLVAPFLVTSMPAAWLGGSLHLPQGVFLWLLAATLALVLVRIYLLGDLRLRLRLTGAARLVCSLLLGAVLGFVAGTVGIGGGIYLVPLLIMFGLADEKRAAAAGAVFIWLNSAVGLAARWQQGHAEAATVLPLVGAVAVGGWLGSSLGALRFSPRTIQRTLGLVVAAAVVVIAGRLPLP
ncbi:MAG: sulfite exporter TauE/SafE family protein [Krumholzibacteria bacterium]|nr:sulfite exporter TauE/SafE family protein [Candidatus Krumholzibacteria bacterium]